MANIVKLKNVHLYTGLTAGAADCAQILKLFQDANVSFITLNYSDQEEQHKANFAALSTWPVGKEGQTKSITDYPIVVYDVFYDDWSTHREIEHGMTEIKNGLVLKYPEMTV